MGDGHWVTGSGCPGCDLSSFEELGCCGVTLVGEPDCLASVVGCDGRGVEIGILLAVASLPESEKAFERAIELDFDCVLYDNVAASVCRLQSLFGK